MKLNCFCDAIINGVRTSVEKRTGKFTFSIKPHKKSLSMNTILNFSFVSDVAWPNPRFSKAGGVLFEILSTNVKMSYMGDLVE